MPGATRVHKSRYAGLGRSGAQPVWRGRYDLDGASARGLAPSHGVPPADADNFAHRIISWLSGAMVGFRYVPAGRTSCACAAACHACTILSRNTKKRDSIRVDHGEQVPRLVANRAPYQNASHECALSREWCQNRSPTSSVGWNGRGSKPWSRRRRELA